jgi:hypothetical protein
LFVNVIEIEELGSYNKQDYSEEPIDEETRKAKFRLLGPLGQGHNIIVHIRGSASRTKEFKTLVRRMISIDNCTR